MHAFCCLFDENYITRGYAMYSSLKDNANRDDYRFFVLGMDDNTIATFENSEGITVITIDEITSYFSILDELKKERDHTEFCWSLSAFLIKYVLKNYDVESCTYLDADLFFYSDPIELLEQMGEQDVLLTPHNYSVQYDQTDKSGKFCVQFLTFRNTKEAFRVLDYWVTKISEKCSRNAADGTFGDQKYLDDWEGRFGNLVYVCNEPGAGLAPWNCQKYEVVSEESGHYLVDIVTKVRSKLFFYHFHSLLRINDDLWRLAARYVIPASCKPLYRQYIERISLIRLKGRAFLFPSKTAEKVCMCRFLPCIPDEKLYYHIDSDYRGEGRRIIFTHTITHMDFSLKYVVLKNGTIRIIETDNIDYLGKTAQGVAWHLFVLENHLPAENLAQCYNDLIKYVEGGKRIRIEYVCKEGEKGKFCGPLCEIIGMYHLVDTNTYLAEKTVTVMR